MNPLQLAAAGVVLMIAILVVLRMLAGSVREITSHERGPDVAAQGLRHDRKGRKP